MLSTASFRSRRPLFSCTLRRCLKEDIRQVISPARGLSAFHRGAQNNTIQRIANAVPIDSRMPRAATKCSQQQRHQCRRRGVPAGRQFQLKQHDAHARRASCPTAAPDRRAHRRRSEQADDALARIGVGSPRRRGRRRFGFLAPTNRSAAQGSGARPRARRPPRSPAWRPASTGRCCPPQRGSSGEPGTANTSRPCSSAIRAVIREPERRAASTTTTPSASPEISRLRRGKSRARGSQPSGISG